MDSFPLGLPHHFLHHPLTILAYTFWIVLSLLSDVILSSTFCVDLAQRWASLLDLCEEGLPRRALIIKLYHIKGMKC
jgi:hypothetical protein